MIAMQYSFVLPGDYDMKIVDRRISEKGRLIDEFPNMVFKAYLLARKSGAASENLYAPFYVWERSDGLNDFICGPNFVGLTQSFGWPSVRQWSVWSCRASDRIKSAKFAIREIISVTPYTDLVKLRSSATEDVAADIEQRGALASVAAFEPTTWSQVRFRLWDTCTAVPEGATAYDIGYMSVNGRN